MAVFSEEGISREVVQQFVKAEVAEQSINSRLKVAKARVLPMRLKVIEDMKRNQKIHIFNVGPWPQWINTGSTGQYLVPACPWGEKYVELLTLDGDKSRPTYGKMIPPISVIMDELVIKSEDDMSRLEEDGRLFAESMIGIGRAQNPEYALTRFGIFVAAGDKPTEQELAAVHRQLNEHCRQQVKFAADLYAIDRALFSRAVRPDVHFVAARVLGRDNPVDSPWMLDASPVGRIKCPMCAQVCDPDAAKCQCGQIINVEKYTDLMAAQEQIMAATKPKGK